MKKTINKIKKIVIKKKKTKEVITKSMIISEIVEKYPKTIPVLINSGMHCIGCSISAIETLEQGFKIHGFNKKRIDEIIKKLNSIVKKTSVCFLDAQK